MGRGNLEMVTIKDVAKKAGVSVSAVSRALNNYTDINAKTKAKILQVVEEMHYYPNASARRLVTNRSYTIGIFYPANGGPGLRQPFIAHLLEVFKTAIGMSGYDLLLFGDEKHPYGQFSFLDRVEHRDLDGVLLLGSPDETIDELLASNVPIVGMDHVAAGQRVGSITSDNRRAIHELVQLLKANGYSKFGFCHGDLTLPVAMERLQGFYSGLSAAQMTPRKEWIFDNAFTFEGGIRVAHRILELAQKPDVVIFSGDISAIGALQVFSEQNIRVPDDISVVGFDDIDAASYVYPKLTTIKQDKEEMGRLAAELLVDLIENTERSMPQHFVLPTQLIVRNTTRPLVINGL